MFVGDTCLFEGSEGCLLGADGEGYIVAFGELPAEFWGHGTFDVDVEFKFWHLSEERRGGVDVGRSPLLTLLVS